MSSDDLFIEIDSAQIYKHGEAIGGDNFSSKKFKNGERIVSVLSDGLGSGVKANILSNMTVQMGLRFIGSDSDILHSSEMMMDALPTCQVRKISYATFSIVDNLSESSLRIIEMDNPACIYIRNGEELKLQEKVIYSPRHSERKIHIKTLVPLPEDRLIICSDGITQAGHGSEEYKLGWRRKGCVEYIKKVIKENPTISSRALSRLLVESARRKSIDLKAHDDMTAAVFYYRTPRKLLVMTGPPFSSEKDKQVATKFSLFSGKRVVCGGTTAKILSREFDEKMTYDMSTRDREIPPISQASFADLITEGILTLTKCAQLLERGEEPLKRTGASLLVKNIIESDSINFLVGTRINEAHQDPNLPVDLEIRRNIVKRIAKTLREKYLKEVTITYI